MKEVTISLDSYKIDEWKSEILKQCIRDNPDVSKKRIAQLLGLKMTAFEGLSKKTKIYHTKKISIILPHELETIEKYTMISIDENELKYLKDKAKKWDALSKSISEFYHDEVGEYNEKDPVRKGDLIEIGKLAAEAFGWL